MPRRARGRLPPAGWSEEEDKTTKKGTTAKEEAKETTAVVPGTPTNSNKEGDNAAASPAASVPSPGSRSAGGSSPKAGSPASPGRFPILKPGGGSKGRKDKRPKSPGGAASGKKRPKKVYDPPTPDAGSPGAGSAFVPKCIRCDEQTFFGACQPNGRNPYIVKCNDCGGIDKDLDRRVALGKNLPPGKSLTPSQVEERKAAKTTKDSLKKMPDTEKFAWYVAEKKLKEGVQRGKKRNLTEHKEVIETPSTSSRSKRKGPKYINNEKFGDRMYLRHLANSQDDVDRLWSEALTAPGAKTLFEDGEYWLGTAGSIHLEEKEEEGVTTKLRQSAMIENEQDMGEFESLSASMKSKFHRSKSDKYNVTTGANDQGVDASEVVTLKPDEMPGGKDSDPAAMMKRDLLRQMEEKRIAEQEEEDAKEQRMLEFHEKQQADQASKKLIRQRALASPQAKVASVERISLKAAISKGCSDMAAKLTVHNTTGQGYCSFVAELVTDTPDKDKEEDKALLKDNEKVLKQFKDLVSKADVRIEQHRTEWMETYAKESLPGENYYNMTKDLIPDVVKKFSAVPEFTAVKDQLKKVLDWKNQVQKVMELRETEKRKQEVENASVVSDTADGGHTKVEQAMGKWLGKNIKEPEKLRAMNIKWDMEADLFAGNNLAEMHTVLIPKERGLQVVDELSKLQGWAALKKDTFDAMNQRGMDMASLPIHKPSVKKAIKTALKDLPDALAPTKLSANPAVIETTEPRVLQLLKGATSFFPTTEVGMIEVRFCTEGEYYVWGVDLMSVSGDGMQGKYKKIGSMDAVEFTKAVEQHGFFVKVEAGMSLITPSRFALLTVCTESVVALRWLITGSPANQQSMGKYLGDLFVAFSNMKDKIGEEIHKQPKLAS